MEAFKYQIEVIENECAAIHGWKTIIDEIYIPKYMLFINNHDGINVFRGQPDRMADTRVSFQIDDKLVEDLYNFFLNREELRVRIVKLFPKKKI